MATGAIYPSPGFHFKVVFEGLDSEAEIDTRFQEVTGLNAELSAEELVEGGENRFVYKLPVRTKFPNLVLKWGSPTTQSSPLNDWVRGAMYNFDFKLCDVQVTLLNEKHEPAAAWKFNGVYPVKWNVSDLKATDNSFVIEVLELAYQRSERMASLT